MARHVPQELYDEVFALTTTIAQPYPCSGKWDESIACDAFNRLAALYRVRESSGTPDPFLTEALADFTEDDGEAILLYQLALNQSKAFPGEPTHTKRLGLAWRLHESGRAAEAREQLALTRRDAFVAKNATDLQEMDELAAQLGA